MNDQKGNQPSTQQREQLSKAVEDALLAANERLVETNDALRKQRELDWRLPHLMFWVIAGIGILRTISEVSVVSDVTQNLDDMRSHKESTAKDINDIEIRLKAAIGTQQTSLKSVLKTDALAHKVIALLNIAQDQLYQQKNPRRALEYLRQISGVITQAKNSQEPNLPLSRVLTELNASTQILYAECYLSNGDAKGLKRAADALVCKEKTPCPNYEGYYYQGLLYLYAYSNTDIDNLKKDALEKAAASFRQAANGDSHSQVPLQMGPRDGSLVYLSGVLTVLGDYKASIDESKKYLKSLLDTGASFTPARQQIFTDIAKDWQEISRFIRGDIGVLDPGYPPGCAIAPISRFEAEMMKALFEGIIKKRNAIIRTEGDPVPIAMLVQKCIRAFDDLQLACGQEPVECIDCDPDEGNEGRKLAEYGLFPIPDPSDFDIPKNAWVVSSNPRLGRPDGDKLLMAYWTVEPVEETEEYDTYTTQKERRTIEAYVVDDENQTVPTEIEYEVESSQSKKRTRSYKIYQPVLRIERFDNGRINNLPRRCYHGIAIPELADPAAPKSDPNAIVSPPISKNKLTKSVVKQWCFYEEKTITMDIAGLSPLLSSAS